MRPELRRRPQQIQPGIVITISQNIWTIYTKIEQSTITSMGYFNFLVQKLFEKSWEMSITLSGSLL